MDIYLKNSKSSLCKARCTRMLTAALFTVAETQRPPKRPGVEAWLEKTWPMYEVAYSSHVTTTWWAWRT